MKKQISTLLGMVAMAAMSGGMVAQSATPAMQTTAKAVAPTATVLSMPGKRVERDNANPWKHSRTAKQNQRQKRKFARQCPHQRSRQGLKKK